MKKEPEQVVVGLDVAKAKLDVHVNGKHFVVANDDDGHESLIRRIRDYPVRVVVMEATGGYEAGVALALSRSGVPVAIVNPRQVRAFAKACGYLAKTDKIDAQLIAEFGSKLDIEPQVLPNEEQRKLKALVKRRRQLISALRSEQSRLAQAETNEVRADIEDSVDFLQRKIKKLDDDIDDGIKASKVYSAKAALLESVPGIGPKTSSLLLAELPELGSVSNKRIATLVGVAPMNCDSGTQRGKRTTWGGRAHVRAALYMPTLCAIRSNSVIQEAYDRMVAAGKPPMTAIVAMMRKLLITLNALLRKNQAWNPSFA